MDLGEREVEDEGVVGKSEDSNFDQMMSSFERRFRRLEAMEIQQTSLYVKDEVSTPNSKTHRHNSSGNDICKP